MTRELITVSRKRSWQTCPRLHQYRYEHAIVPRTSSSALRFGTAVHNALEQWWGGSWSDTRDPVDHDEARLLAAMAAYSNRWGSERVKAQAIEAEFSFPLRSPNSGYRSRHFDCAGKIDAVVMREPDLMTWVMEHKTTSLDLRQPDYWERLRLDAQIATYVLGARSLGHEPVGVCYDVIGKPAARPLLATPEDKRRFSKTTGELDKRQRLDDESPVAFHERLLAAYEAEPERYLQRRWIPLADLDLDGAAADMWQVSLDIHSSQRSGIAPKNPQRCNDYNRQCGYYGLCTGDLDADDENVYQIKKPHSELEQVTDKGQ